MLRNNSDMPKTLKNKMVSGNPRPYSIYNPSFLLNARFSTISACMFIYFPYISYHMIYFAPF